MTYLAPVPPIKAMSLLQCLEQQQLAWADQRRNEGLSELHGFRQQHEFCGICRAVQIIQVWLAFFLAFLFLPSPCYNNAKGVLHPVSSVRSRKDLKDLSCRGPLSSAPPCGFLLPFTPSMALSYLLQT